METLVRNQYTLGKRICLATPVERHAGLFAVVIILVWSLTLLFLLNEIFLASQVKFIANKAGRECWLAIIAEILLSFQELILAFGLLTGLWSSAGRSPRPTIEILGDSAPTVDVFITCCGEAPEIVLDTVKAAASQDYPVGNFRIVVLDDGHNDELRRHIDLLKPWLEERRLAVVVYSSRRVKRGTKTYFKAGNINHGIFETAGSPPSDFFAALDCDMIPESSWLKRSVGHLVLDDKLGMTVAPQNYYNVPPGDPLGQQADFSMYFTVQEVLNDSVSACMCTGTGYVARRKAIVDIGGWPLAESGEDYMCSALLSNAGWSIAYVRDSIQWGLCPESMRVLLKQRMRWTDAAIEVFKRFRFYLQKTDLTAEMTLSQRLVNWLYVMRDYAPLTNVLAMIVLPLALYPTESTISKVDELRQVYSSSSRNLKLLLILSWASNKLFYLLMYNHLSLSHLWNFQSNEMWAAPYMAYRCFLSLLPSTIQTPNFAVCGSFPSSERSQRSRPFFLARLLNPHTLLWISYMIYASIPLLITSGPSTFRFRTFAFLPPSKPSSPTVKVISIAPFVPGATLKLISTIMKMVVPVKYMLFPPTMPERDEMLFMDELGVRRVKEEWKGRGEKDREWRLWACVAGVEMLVLAILTAWS